MHYGNACACQDDLISIAQFDLDRQQNISSSQTECNSFLSVHIISNNNNSEAVDSDEDEADE
jgi:hypothetical protein